MGHRSGPFVTRGETRRPSPRAARPESPHLAGEWNPDALREGVGALDDGVDARRCCAVPCRCGRGGEWQLASERGALGRGMGRRNSAARGRTGGRSGRSGGIERSAPAGGCRHLVWESRSPASWGWTSSPQPGRLRSDPGFATLGRPGGTVCGLCTPRPLLPRGRDLLFHRRVRRYRGRAISGPSLAASQLGEPDPRSPLDLGQNQIHHAAGKDASLSGGDRRPGRCDPCR